MKRPTSLSLLALLCACGPQLASFDTPGHVCGQDADANVSHEDASSGDASRDDTHDEPPWSATRPPRSTPRPTP